MQVLLVNDDGVHAEGLRALGRRLEDAGVEVCVVAPERERSAMGHAITLHKPLHASPVRLPELRGPAWAVSGTPADCTKLGILGLMERHPDLVVSGINRGANVGLDVLYSGTVSAAIEGVILGVPSLAVSQAGLEEPDFVRAADFTARLIDRLPRPGEPPFLLNINIPPCGADRVAGVALTRLGVRQYTDVVHPRRDPRGRTYYWLAGQPRDAENDDETDVWALAHDLVSITPLHLELTDEPLRRRLRPWAAGLLPGP